MTLAVLFPFFCVCSVSQFETKKNFIVSHCQAIQSELLESTSGFVTILYYIFHPANSFHFFRLHRICNRISHSATFYSSHSWIQCVSRKMAPFHTNGFCDFFIWNLWRKKNMQHTFAANGVRKILSKVICIDEKLLRIIQAIKVYNSTF